MCCKDTNYFFNFQMFSGLFTQACLPGPSYAIRPER